MCVVSMVAQDWTQRHPQWTIPNTAGPAPANVSLFTFPDYVPRAEFEALKAELESLKRLLLAAKRYDAETGQRDCEDAEKVALFKRLAELVGVDMAEVFATSAESAAGTE
jgi:hypothetical protein